MAASGARGRTYSYRREPTPGGVDRMRRGELEHFDLEMYANLNTGVLEEYLEAKNRRDGFARAAWRWRRVAVGVGIGSLFALVNVFVGLKVGLIVYGAWYAAYLAGLGMRWRPGDVSLAGGAANGTSFVVTGFVYVFPAIFLLSALNAGQYEPLVPASALPPVPLVVVATVLAGMLGVLYFVVFRRLWLVEDPLPFPTFEGFVKLLDMADDLSAAAAERARHTLRAALAVAGGSALFAFLRDVPIVRPAGGGAAVPALSYVAGGSRWYSAEHGLQLPLAWAHWSWASFALSPLLIATGWFMRSRAALALAAGSAFAWFVAVPLAVGFNVPVFRPALGGDVGLQELAALGEPAALLAHAGVVRTMAAGALLGGGLTALLKMAPTLRTATADLLRARPRSADAYVAGRGWYEWPARHVLVVAAVALVALPLALVAAGHPLGAGLAFAAVLVAAAFLLGAVAVKVMGETSLEPVSGTSLLVLVALLGVLLVIGLPTGAAVALALLGATVFACAIAMTGDVLLDAKNALYVGVTPHLQMKAALVGLVPGAVVGAVAATALSGALASGAMPLAAPQANAFATAVAAVAGSGIDPNVLLLGVAFGVLVEVLTGLGAAFGIGMFLPVGVVAPLVAGGLARDWWERRVLDPAAERGSWSDEKRTIRLLDTYMVAAGLIVGEAVVGTLIAIYLSAGLLTG